MQKKSEIFTLAIWSSTNFILGRMGAVGEGVEGESSTKFIQGRGVQRYPSCIAARCYQSVVKRRNLNGCTCL